MERAIIQRGNELRSLVTRWTIPLPRHYTEVVAEPDVARAQSGDASAQSCRRRLNNRTKDGIILKCPP